MSYRPKPIDTSQIKLPRSLVDLTEQLAANAHDIWASNRLAEGWSYGPHRNDRTKESPDLVPYPVLSEGEKQYDRNVVLETLKAIRALGYSIQPAQTRTDGKPLERVGADASDAVDLREHPHGMSSNQAANVPDSPNGATEDPIAYLLRGEEFLRAGDPLSAHDVLARGLEQLSPEKQRVREGRTNRRTYVRLLQLTALALARAGAVTRANQILAQLHAQGECDAETMGILARTYKDMGLSGMNRSRRASYLRKSAVIYKEAYELARSRRDWNGALYTGINAATVSLWCGGLKESVRIAAEVKSICRRCLRRLNRSVGSTGRRQENVAIGSRQAEIRNRREAYWFAATLGEAHLLLEDLTEARKWYTRASEIGGSRHADQSSSRRQARRILKHLGHDPQLLDSCFRIPGIYVYCGHLIDSRARSSPRFPAARTESVAREIARRLGASRGNISYGSAACGSDILFLEAMLEREGEVHVVLPFPVDQFRKFSVRCSANMEWEKRFDRVLRAAASVQVTGEWPGGNPDTALSYCDAVTDGMAAMRAKSLDAPLVCLAVWDGDERRTSGGTFARIQAWKERGNDIDIISLRDPQAGVVDRSLNRPASRPPIPQRRRTNWRKGSIEPGEHQVAAMLFADVAGYSRLSEEQFHVFARRFLGALSVPIQEYRRQLLLTRTAGDGLFLVLRDVVSAGRLALDLRDAARFANLKRWNLPNSLGLRIGLHAGPVVPYSDPITGRIDFAGSHLIRAARIEPITPPGHVYGSQAFAALAALETDCGFECDYAGQIPLAKHYGMIPIHPVRRIDETP